MKSTRELVNHIPQRGCVEWIGIRSKSREPVVVLEQVQAVSELGLKGDRYRTKGGKRQVTLVQHEHLPVIGAILGGRVIEPETLRRNIVVSGVNLFALRNQRFRIGEAIFEGTGHCHPCSRMEEAMGVGGFAAMRGHGGITAKVVQEGLVRLGDVVSREPGLAPNIDEIES
jgi:MOSC domain-containing protein YiiM